MPLLFRPDRKNPGSSATELEDAAQQQAVVIGAIVLDFDNTLYQWVDWLEERIWEDARLQAVQLSLQKENTPATPEKVQNTLGNYVAQARQIGWRTAARDVLGLTDEEFTQILIQVPREQYMTYDHDLMHLLWFLHEHTRLFIFTGSGRATAYAALRVMVGQEVACLFRDRMLGAEDMHQGQKPAREAYEEMLERFGLDPERTLFVDDTPKEIRTAMQLGMPSIWVETGRVAVAHEDVPGNATVGRVHDITRHVLIGKS